MMDETRFLQVLDFLSDRAKEFANVSDDVLKGERALQARDAELPKEWQTCSLISAFINYVAESERVRYGHFVCDMEKKNSSYKIDDAINTLARMKLFWAYDDADDASEAELDERRQLVGAFLDNEAEIKQHLSTRPDMYQPGVPQFTHREWSLKLRLLGEKEALLLRQWDDLLRSQVAKRVTAGAQE